jgi:hypothetical protein
LKPDAVRRAAANRKGLAVNELEVAVIGTGWCGAAVLATLLGAAPGPPDATTIQGVVRWLLTPISGSSAHPIVASIAWHGQLMVLGMGLLTPPVVIVARFFKVTPRQDWPHHLDNPFWFVTHRRWGHVIGLIVAAGLAFVLAAYGWQPPWYSLHTATGWGVLVLVLIQVAGSWLRGTHGGPVDPFTRRRRPPEEWHGDHFSMTRRRIVFEYIHKSAGYVLLVLSLVAIPTGLVAADAPRWMPIAMGIWWLLMLGVFVWLQRAGLCTDTYQAIWGLDPDLPGNRRRPIGFGIVRIRR